ncbi:MAG: radical SAM family heme chaperone HemW [Thermoanaerobaculaceae bacterium]|nr:radical SAM family heme chaperone HemW [Thermoanaerobaculaceae bacterium]
MRKSARAGSGVSNSAAPTAPYRRHSCGLYLHVPLCVSRCSYCAFVSTTELEQRGRLVSAIAGELDTLGRRAGRELRTLYFGGGTPSLLGAAELATIMAALRRWFVVAPGAEFTLEANPEDVAEERLQRWARLGVTRLSLGVQSFDENILRRLGRRHSAVKARWAVAAALAHGFTVSLDLMVGVPGEGAKQVEQSITEVLQLLPHHVSVYLLELDKPTPLAALATRCPDTFPDEDAAARAYLQVGKALVGAGYHHYEVSNFARPGFSARHNLRYWLGRSVLGVGPAAAGQVGRQRFANVEDIQLYLERLEAGSSPRAWARTLSEHELGVERLMLGLRLAQGVGEGAVQRLAPPEFCEQLQAFLALGLARRRGRRVRLTPRGWLVSSELLAYLV